MPALEVGDILMLNSSWPGHIGMVYEDGETGAVRGSAKVIHAQRALGFHVESVVKEQDGLSTYMTEGGVARYRAPWDSRPDAVQKKAYLRRMAARIGAVAEYSTARWPGLATVSSHFGSGARERLRKYKARMFDERDVVVKNVTCAEAVILCYQMTFPEGDYPFFIQKDAKHTMPRTLAEWLEHNWGPPTNVE